MKPMYLLRPLVGLLLAAACLTAMAQEGGGASNDPKGALCPDSGAITSGKFISDLCWGCIFPIRLAGVGGGGKDFPADPAAPVCLCPSKSTFGIPTPGVTLGMWKPTHFVETVSQPGCMPAIGQQANLGSVFDVGHGGSGQNPGDAGFRNVHVYSFPTGAVLDMVTSAACGDESYDMDMLSLSELDPTWANPSLAMMLSPEANLFNNEIATLACMADAAASTSYRPIQSLFWCFGSWGNVYPQMGYTNARSAVQDASISAARVVALNHKRFLMKKTYGNEAVCTDVFHLPYPKHQYRWQVLYPFPQREGNEWTGASTLNAREWRHLAVTGEDWVQVLWRYEECCVHIY